MADSIQAKPWDELTQAEKKCKVRWRLLVDDEDTWNKYPDLRAIITVHEGAPVLTFQDVLGEQSWTIAHHIVKMHNDSLKPIKAT